MAGLTKFQSLFFLPIFIFAVVIIIIECIYYRLKKSATNKINEKIASIKTNGGVCPLCGGKLIMRNGKYGRFIGCSNYPKCKYTEK